MSRNRVYQPAERKYVFFSNTYDNPFLPKSYIDGLKETLDPKMALRMIEGLWVEITTDIIYHQYGNHNYRKTEYQLKPYHPIYITFDFNIGEGKPMSCALIQDIKDKKGDLNIHVFDECIVEGADTEGMMEELASRGLLDHDCEYIINGDATGGARTTKSKSSDYDIIKKFLANYRSKNGAIDFSIQVPKANPPIRKRHNVVNAYCRNAVGKTRFFVYEKCKMVHKGMRLTSLKPGGKYLEDDSKPYQHVTTAVGYHIWWVDRSHNTKSGVRVSNYR